MKTAERSLKLTNVPGDEENTDFQRCLNAESGDLNRNLNNFSGSSPNESSDWEEFILESELTSEFEISAPRKELQNPKKNLPGSELLGSKCNNEDNFVMLLSDDQNEVLRRKKFYTCKESSMFSNDYQDKFTPNGLVGQFMEDMWKCLKEFWDIIMSIYFILMYKYLFRFCYNIMFFLKVLFNGSTTFILIPSKIVYNRIKMGLMKLKGLNVCRCQFRDSNNNAIDSVQQKPFTFFWVYALCLAVVIGGLFIHCRFHPELKICAVNAIVNESKLKIMSFSHELYILPGEDCMRIGKCCKGFMESIFRWINCFITSPIRSILTAWPRQSQEKESFSQNPDETKVKIEGFIRDLSEAKDRTIRQEELLLKIRHQFNVLEKLIEEKYKEVSSLEPILKSMRNMMEKMSFNITQGINEIKSIISIEEDSEKIIETMKLIAKDSFHSVKLSIAKIHGQIDAEHNRLNTRVEVLESIVNEDRDKVTNTLNNFLYKVKSEIEQLKLNQKDIQKRFSAFKEIPIKYKKMSEGLKTEIKKKLFDELKIHDIITKKTESFCLAKINKFKEELEQPNSHFTCFVERMIGDQAKKVENKLNSEVSANLFENSVEIAKSKTEESLNKQSKNPSFNQHNFQSTNIMREFNRIEPVPYSCDSENTEKITNYSAFCLNNQYLKENFNENNECLSNEQIQHMVQVSVAKYSADKIGLADFALDSMGGSVLASQSSPTYNSDSGLFSFFTLPIFRSSKSLRNVIQPGNQPGDCWPFSGSTGHVSIQLSHKIYISAISLEHLPVSLHPEGNIVSAPKQFKVFSLSEHSYERQDLIGTFEYVEGGPSIQTFLVEVQYPARVIQMVILSNHGNEEYTCVYRLRVHGTLNLAHKDNGK